MSNLRTFVQVASTAARSSVLCLAVLSLTVAAGCGSATSSNPAPGASASGAPATTTPKPATPAACQAPCAEVKGQIVHVTGVQYDAQSGNEFVKPDPGNVFVRVDVTFTNNSNQELSANPFNFVLLDGSGIKHMSTFTVGDCQWQAVNITKGASLGPKCLAFQATAGKPSPLTLVWNPSLLGGDHSIKIA
jgi:hypothetical protein